MVPPPAVERGGQCSAHVEVMVGLTQVQGELGHMRQNFDQVTASNKVILEKLDELRETRSNPEITKAFIIGLFGLFGGGITVVVAIITNADKLGKLIGWGV